MKKLTIIISALILSANLFAGEKGSFFDNLELTMTADGVIYNDAIGYGGTLGLMTDLGGDTFMKNFMIGLGGRYKGAVDKESDLMVNSVGGYGLIGYQIPFSFGLRILPTVKSGALYQMKEMGEVSTSEADIFLYPAVQLDYMIKNFRIGVESGYLMTFSENLVTNIQVSLFASYTFRNMHK